MSDDGQYYDATPAASLEEHILNPNIAKSETEWWAHREILRLRAQLHSEIVSHADMQKAYEFQRDTLWGERAALRKKVKALELELLSYKKETPTP